MTDIADFATISFKRQKGYVRIIKGGIFMKKRLRELKAFILVTVLIAELFGINNLRALADNIYLTEAEVIESDTDSNYNTNGYTITINNGAKVNGIIYGSGGTIENYGGAAQISTLTGALNNYLGASVDSINSASGTITNNGTITYVNGLKGTLTNTGTVGTLVFDSSDSGNYGLVQMDGGTITTLKSESVNYNADGSYPQVVLNGGTVNQIDSAGALYVNVTGDVSVGTISGAVNFLGSGTINVTGNLALSGDYSSITPVLKVSETTQIKNVDGSKIKVQYNGQSYLITENATGTISELCGNTISVGISDENTIDMGESTVFSETDKYMYGDEATATYVAAEGYYFPEDYAVTTDGSGMIYITRIDAKTISVSYTFDNVQNKVVNITIPAASERMTQAAPASLVGGEECISGVTEAMEYAKSADATEWTACTSGTMNFTAGIWYIRYKATDVYKASDAVAVSVLEKKQEVQYIPAPAPVYYISGTKGLNGYYVSDIQILAPEGYMLSVTENGVYTESITINEKSNFDGIYLMRKSDGLKTKKINADILIDTVLPSVNVDDKQIYYTNSLEIIIDDDNLSEVYIDGLKKVFSGSSCTISLASFSGEKVYEIKAVDKAGNVRTFNVTVAAEWLKSGEVPKGTAVRLTAGKAYKLGSGTWKVSGDNTSYSGNITFYVGNEGSYTFE